ncbi:MAG: cytochrome c [Acidobacteriota bacterium]|nr:cytochrome c [Acidobacteriota bacterium]
MKSGLGLALLAAFLSAPSSPARAQAPAGPPKFDPAAVARGQQLFVATCGFCHGSRAKGGEKGPDLLRSVLVLDDEGGNSIGRVVLKGRPEKGMPKFALSPPQISDIAMFLHSSIAAAANRDQYKVLNIVTGDPKAGEAYFNGAGHCSECHSVTGDLKGIGSKYEPVTLQDHIVMPREQSSEGAARSANPLITVTVTLPSGKSFTGIPVNIDDFNVALRDGAGDYHSFTRKSEDDPRVELHNRLKSHSAMLTQYSDSDIHNLTAYLVTLK